MRLLGGSYLSLVTGFTVVSLGTAAAWILPSAVGVPLIASAVNRAKSRAVLAA